MSRKRTISDATILAVHQRVQNGKPIVEACQREGISRQTYLNRYKAALAALSAHADNGHTPLSSEPVARVAPVAANTGELDQRRRLCAAQAVLLRMFGLTVEILP